MSQDDLEYHLAGELRVLDELRRSHRKQYPGSLLEREDPDIQRMIEAMALFSVRTRLSQQRNLQSTWRRLFASYFDFLLAPLPSVAMAQAVVSPRLVDAINLERGTQLRLTTPSGLQGTFTTLSALRLLPISLNSVDLRKRDGGSLLLLQFGSRFSRTDAVDQLRLHIHCADHYESALAMHYQLRAHLKRVFVVYDPQSIPSDGASCAVSFGEQYEAPADSDPINPLEGVRRFFHFPERELFLNLTVPRSQRAWSTFIIGLELGPDYIAEPEPGRDSFQLFTVPIENRVRVPAAQIYCDGTSAGYPIRAADPAAGLSLVTVRGVSRVTAAGVERMRPSVLSASDSGDGYELEEQLDESASNHLLIVRAPQALVSPFSMHVDAEWHQPDFAKSAVGRQRVSVPHRSMDGVTWQLLGPVRAPHDSVLRRNTEGLLQLLSLRMKPVLSRSELLTVFDVVGTIATSPYRKLPVLLRELRVEAAMDSALRGSGLRHIYSVALERINDLDEPLVWHFLVQLQRLLDCWNAEAAVDLQVDTGDREFATPIPGREP